MTAENTIVVPGRSYAELMRILPDAEAPVDITITPNRSGSCSTSRGSTSSALIEGQFPNYEPVVPREGSWTAKATLNREDFLAGTRRPASSPVTRPTS